MRAEHPNWTSINELTVKNPGREQTNRHVNEPAARSIPLCNYLFRKGA